MGYRIHKGVESVVVWRTLYPVPLQYNNSQISEPETGRWTHRVLYICLDVREFYKRDVVDRDADLNPGDEIGDGHFGFRIRFEVGSDGEG